MWNAGKTASSTINALEISSTSLVWTYGTSENNFGINHKLEKYLLDSCLSISDQHFSLKYFTKKWILLDIYQQYNQAFLGFTGMNGLTSM